MLQVYMASKLHHFRRWRALRAQWSNLHFTARWPDMDVSTVPGTPEEARKHWIEDEEDVRAADAVLVYAEDGEHLRGALVEAGMAIALRKTVVVVGTHPDFGTWQHHPRVIQARDLEEARQRLEELSLRG